MIRFMNVRTFVTTLVVVTASLATVVFLPHNSMAFTPHDPIYIDGNGAFTPANGVTGGSGTPSDPFIIEGWDVNDWGNWGSGILIMNTDAHFVIRSVLSHDGVWGPFGGEIGSGIVIGPNVANGHVEGTETFRNVEGIVVGSSSNITILANTVSRNHYSGIHVDSSSNVTITRNIGDETGISMSPDSDPSAGSAGVWITRSSAVTIIGNHLTRGDDGVNVIDSVNVTVTDNYLLSNTRWGAYLQNSERIAVYHNQFVDNRFQASDDRGGGNRWDDGCSSGGNYWSDYSDSDETDCSTGSRGGDGFGDAPYIIDADSRDRYPKVSSSTVEPIKPYWNNRSSIVVDATTKENSPGIRSITLWYRYSADNMSWGNWTIHYNLIMPPWTWPFQFPDGQGHYEFYASTINNMGKVEPPPSTADAMAGYDSYPPTSRAMPISPYWHTNLPIVINAAATDNLSGVANVTLYYSHAPLDNSTWSPWIPIGTGAAPPWSWSFSFPNGQGHYRFHTIAMDVAGNVEASKSTAEAIAGHFIPTEPPTTSLHIGWPNYTSTATYVKSTTPLDFSVVDQGGTGINYTSYRVDNVTWTKYSSSFFLSDDGDHYVEWYSEDNVGNVEDVLWRVLRVDDTPPVTAIDPAMGPYTPATIFTLAATDAGCGVNSTRVRIDGGGWVVYSGGFTLVKGEHNITYYSNDWLNNTEREKWLVVTVEGTTTPPKVAVNYKPIIALIIAIILLVAGVWSSKRRPWKGGKDKMAVAKAFLIASLPFVVAEAGTGIVSLFTGQLSIPPLMGVGTAVDLSILMAGISVAILRALRPETPGPEEGEGPGSR